MRKRTILLLTGATLIPRNDASETIVALGPSVLKSKANGTLSEPLSASYGNPSSAEVDFYQILLDNKIVPFKESEYKEEGVCAFQAAGDDTLCKLYPAIKYSAPKTGCYQPCHGDSCAFECDLEAGFHRDPNDCKAFCQCTGHKAKNSLWARCQGDSLWNPDTKVCDWQKNAECTRDCMVKRYEPPAKGISPRDHTIRPWLWAPNFCIAYKSLYWRRSVRLTFEPCEDSQVLLSGSGEMYDKVLANWKQGHHKQHQQWEWIHLGGRDDKYHLQSTTLTNRGARYCAAWKIPGLGIGKYARFTNKQRYHEISITRCTGQKGKSRNKIDKKLWWRFDAHYGTIEPFGVKGFCMNNYRKLTNTNSHAAVVADVNDKGYKYQDFEQWKPVSGGSAYISRCMSTNFYHPEDERAARCPLNECSKNCPVGSKCVEYNPRDQPIYSGYVMDHAGRLKDENRKYLCVCDGEVLYDADQRATCVKQVEVPAIPKDPCMKNPCTHGGICFAREPNTGYTATDWPYHCLCPEGRDGPRCEMEVEVIKFTDPWGACSEQCGTNGEQFRMGTCHHKPAAQASCDAAKMMQKRSCHGPTCCGCCVRQNFESVMKSARFASGRHLIDEFGNEYPASEAINGYTGWGVGSYAKGVDGLYDPLIIEVSGVVADTVWLTPQKVDYSKIRVYVDKESDNNVGITETECTIDTLLTARRTQDEITKLTDASPDLPEWWKGLPYHCGTAGKIVRITITNDENPSAGGVRTAPGRDQNCGTACPPIAVSEVSLRLSSPSTANAHCKHEEGNLLEIRVQEDTEPGAGIQIISNRDGPGAERTLFQGEVRAGEYIRVNIDRDHTTKTLHVHGTSEFAANLKITFNNNKATLGGNTELWVAGNNAFSFQTMNACSHSRYCKLAFNDNPHIVEGCGEAQDTIFLIDSGPAVDWDATKTFMKRIVARMHKDSRILALQFANSPLGTFEWTTIGSDKKTAFDQIDIITQDAARDASGAANSNYEAAFVALQPYIAALVDQTGKRHLRTAKTNIIFLSDESISDGMANSALLESSMDGLIANAAIEKESLPIFAVGIKVEPGKTSGDAFSAKMAFSKKVHVRGVYLEPTWETALTKTYDVNNAMCTPTYNQYVNSNV